MLPHNANAGAAGALLSGQPDLLAEPQVPPLWTQSRIVCHNCYGQNKGTPCRRWDGSPREICSAKPSWRATNHAAKL
jgi:hypothetical protein